jgi:hypothetical protein
LGGFAASDWLFSYLQHYLQERGVRFVRPDGHLCVQAFGFYHRFIVTGLDRGKAVADGAVWSVVDQSVIVQASGSVRHPDDIVPWVGDAVASLLEDAQNVKDPTLVVQAAVQACLISCCKHLVISGYRDDENLLTLVPQAGTFFRILYIMDVGEEKLILMRRIFGSRSRPRACPAR